MFVFVLVYTYRPMNVSTAKAGKTAIVYKPKLLVWRSIHSYAYETCSLALMEKMP